VTRWEGAPQNSWFSSNGEYIVVGRAHYSDGSMMFLNGRHRTRWMMDQRFDVIPICLDIDDYYEAWLDGLVVRRVFEGEFIRA